MKNQPTKRLFLSKVGKNAMMLLALAALTACGQKDNKVVADSVGNLQGLPNFSPQQSTQVNQILNSFPCRVGQASANNGMVAPWGSAGGSNQGRLSQTFSFSVAGGYNQGGSRTTVSGQFQQGLMGGNVSGLYVGVSTFGDVMLVSKIGSGSQVQGYSVTLSMCTFSPLVMEGRALSNFQAPSGIILGSDNYCGFGAVDAAMNTLMIAQPFQTQGQYGPINFNAANVYTTFYKPSCNGMY